MLEALEKMRSSQRASLRSETTQRKPMCFMVRNFVDPRVSRWGPLALANDSVGSPNSPFRHEHHPSAQSSCERTRWGSTRGGDSWPVPPVSEDTSEVELLAAAGEGDVTLGRPSARAWKGCAHLQRFAGRRTKAGR